MNYANYTKLFLGIEPRSRWTVLSPHVALEALIAAGSEHYNGVVAELISHAKKMVHISPCKTPYSAAPYWDNIWMRGLDPISIYGFISQNRPGIYLEIGSGFSTMFAHQAITDNNLDTHIISIDPRPREHIDAICRQVIRSPLESVDWQRVIVALSPGDIVFFDGSHRCFQNTDVSVFFTEILPAIPEGVLIGIHDIFLPYDYPEEWSGRLYSEQYLLACWLLADKGNKLRIQFPVYWISHAPAADFIRETLKPLWQVLPSGISQGDGGAFWFTKT